MAFTDISLPNGSSVTKTFKATTNNALTALWKLADTAVSFSNRIGIQLRTRPSTPKQKRKVSVQVVVPYTVDVDTGAVDFVSAHIDFLVGENAPESSIQDVVAYSQNFLGQAVLLDAVSNGVHPS